MPIAISNLIKSLRVKKGFSQSDVARLMGLARPTYNRKEIGKVPFTIEEGKNLAIILESSFEEIFLNEDVTQTN